MAENLEEDLALLSIGGVNLTDLPIEIFINICTYLELDFVNSTLSLVCKRFHDILCDSALWKSWLNRKVGGKKYPPVDQDLTDFDWRRECSAVDKLNYKWSERHSKVHIVAKEAHTAAIDALLLKNNGAICISGSRDRSLAIWDVNKLISDNKTLESIDGNSGVNVKPVKTIDAHDGWLWDIATPSTESNIIFTASWDSSVKIWDLSTMEHVHKFKCPTTALCVTCIDENVCMAGLFTPHIILLDKRVGSAPIHSYRIHRRSVLDITTGAPGSHLIYTTSEDRYLSLFDLNAGNFIKKSVLDESDVTLYGMKIAANDESCKNALFVGDQNGTVHMLDKRDLKFLSSTQLWPITTKKSRVTGMVLQPGALIAASSNGSVKMTNPSSPLNEINEISGVALEYMALDFQNSILAVSDNNYSVNFHIPYSSHLFD